MRTNDELLIELLQSEWKNEFMVRLAMPLGLPRIVNSVRLQVSSINTLWARLKN